MGAWNEFAACCAFAQFYLNRRIQNVASVGCVYFSIGLHLTKDTQAWHNIKSRLVENNKRLQMFAIFFVFNAKCCAHVECKYKERERK